jgi:acyl-CoA thioester hydrolase
MANTLNPRSQGVLRGEHRLAIYYEDTDFSGFVYHANYLKYFERAREHLIGIQFLRELYERGVHFVVNETHLTFKRPAGHGDHLVIRSDVHFSRSPILRCEHAAFREEDPETPLVKGFVNLVTLNQDHRPIRLPDFVTERFGAKGHWL